MNRVRLADVAQAAGVHAATASRALNPAKRDGVNRKTVRRVELAAQRLGYVPNALARGLRTQRSYMVGAVIPDISNTLFPPLVRGAERVLSAAGYTLVLTDTNNDIAAEREQLALLQGRGVDGFIVATATWDDADLEQFGLHSAPVVLVNRNTGGGLLPYVGGDDRRGIHACVDHLVALGHRRIVHLAGPSSTSTGRERTSAFQAAARSHRLSVSKRRIAECTAFTQEEGIRTTRELLDSGDSFTAIVAANDLIALGAIDELRARGIRCPETVSVTGFNDLPFMDRVSPSLTTVRLPLREMGELAAKTLLQRIDLTDIASAARVLLPVQLIERGTTAPAC
jgi:LacI family transcriptional regulator